MKTKCKKSLYWYQSPGYSGSLDENPEFDGKNGKLAFAEGKEYEIVVRPYRDTNTLEYVSIYAIGEDGNAYIFMRQELHAGATRSILSSFDFSEAGKEATREK